MAVREHKFAVLDGLRVVGALTVLFAHVSETSCPWLVPHAYLAVDFFFMLSGFVIASAYEDRLRGEMTLGAFMRLRFIRLYPLLILGVAIGVLGFSHAYHHEKLLLLALASLILLPTPYGALSDGQNVLPLNSPSWTLSWELVANFVFALIVRRLSNRLLALVIFGCAAGLISTAYLHGSLGVGFSWPNAWGGLPRAGFAFFTGVALYRIRKAGALRKIKSSMPVLCAVLLCLFAIPRGFTFWWLYDLGAVMLAFPLIIACGTNAVAGRMAFLCRMGKQLSYPIYILQGGIWTHIRGLPAHFHLHGAMALPILALAVAVYIGFTFVAFNFYDEPVRKWLSRHNKAIFSKSAPVPEDREQAILI